MLLFVAPVRGPWQFFKGHWQQILILVQDTPVMHLQFLLNTCGKLAFVPKFLPL
jgi:hypothetical protein